ncbi:hypothetical protein [Candidatus Cyrtobacter comes]|nr:hypothetical protein [Candidatus Cyrtobacter comes]
MRGHQGIKSKTDELIEKINLLIKHIEERNNILDDYIIIKLINLLIKAPNTYLDYLQARCATIAERNQNERSTNYHVQEKIIAKAYEICEEIARHC